MAEKSWLETKYHLSKSSEVLEKFATFRTFEKEVLTSLTLLIDLKVGGFCFRYHFGVFTVPLMRTNSLQFHENSVLNLVALGQYVRRIQSSSAGKIQIE